MSPRAKEEKEPKSNSPFTVIIRWFTEAKQYLAAFSASIVAYGVLQRQIARIDWSNWVAAILAAIPPLLVFVCQTLPRLIRQRRERLLVESSQRDVANPQPPAGEADYFYIGPYPDSRRLRYDRADGIHKEVLSWLKSTKENVVVISGFSGTGKTSLLQAFAIPELCEGRPPFAVFLIRGFDDPLAELRCQLLDPGLIWKKPGNDLADLALGEIIRRAITRLRQNDPASKLLAVLDQFEELVTLGDSDNSSAVTGVTEFLRQLQKSPIDGFLLLLAVRSDYQTFLEPLGVPPLDQNRNWRQIPAFTQSAALTFLKAPETGLKIHEERLRRVLREASAADGTRGLIRPIILNMLGLVLRRIADSPEAERPTRALLADDLRAFIDHPDRRGIARAILPHMLTEADTKHPRRVSELCSATEMDAHLIHGCLLQLETSGYVRQIRRSEEILNRVWEVSHDFVARLLGPILKNPFQIFWERFRRVFYPLSIGTWAVGAALLIFAGPWLDRKSSESELEKRFGFAIQETPDGYVVTEQLYAFNDLAAASPFLKKLSPLNLNLSHCTQLTSVDGLNGLTALRSLDLSSTEVDNIAALARLSTLQTLNLRETKIWDIEPLTGLTALQSLDVSSTEIDDIEPLRGLRTLQTLNLSSTRVGKLEALRSLAALKSLDLGMMQHVESFEPVKGLTALHTLNLGYSKVGTLEFLRGLTALQDLGLNGINIGNLEILKGLTALQSLSLTDSNFETLEPLKSLTGLHSLTVRGVYVETLEPLKGLTALQTLNLGNTRTKDESLEPLRGLSNLQWLDLSFQNIESLEALRGLAALQWLSLVGTRVQNLEPLEDLTELRRLVLPSTVPDAELRRFNRYRRAKNLAPVAL